MAILLWPSQPMGCFSSSQRTKKDGIWGVSGFPSRVLLAPPTLPNTVCPMLLKRLLCRLLWTCQDLHTSLLRFTSKSFFSRGLRLKSKFFKIQFLIVRWVWMLARPKFQDSTILQLINNSLSADKENHILHRPCLVSWHFQFNLSLTFWNENLHQSVDNNCCLFASLCAQFFKRVWKITFESVWSFNWKL